MNEFKNEQLAKVRILGFENLGYDTQRIVFNKAKMFGWKGEEPSVLGTYHAGVCLNSAIEFLLKQKVTFKKEGTSL